MAQKKRDAFASRHAIPKVQALMMTASSATMKPSTTMEATFAPMKSSATIVPATAVSHGAARPAAISPMIGAAVSIAARTVINAMIVMSNVMLTPAPAMPVGTKMMVVAAIVANRSITNEER